MKINLAVAELPRYAVSTVTEAACSPTTAA